MEQFFPTKSFRSRKQNHYPGSYAISKNELLFPINTSFKLSINLFSTLRKNNPQTLISINNLKLFLSEESKITCEYSGKILTISKTIKIKNWYKLELDYNAQKNKILADACEALARFRGSQNGCKYAESFQVIRIVY